ncbi:hypothetical protein [Kibdelosporangium philippinense]|uniref:hypothetical protein n=1 Tax=Kibdelosporangium philippinense TaxID=211113 RepID=UPI00360AFDEB
MVRHVHDDAAAAVLSAGLAAVGRSADSGYLNVRLFDIKANPAATASADGDFGLYRVDMPQGGGPGFPIPSPIPGT